MPSQSVKERDAAATAEYAAYLLKNECGLPRDGKLEGAAERLRSAVEALVIAEELSPQELGFLVNSAIDIMPAPDIAQAAGDAGFDQEAVARIVAAQDKLVKAMREGG